MKDRLERQIYRKNKKSNRNKYKKPLNHTRMMIMLLGIIYLQNISLSVAVPSGDLSSLIIFPATRHLIKSKTVKILLFSFLNNLITLFVPILKVYSLLLIFLKFLDQHRI